jgi:lysine 6-dehydrogenase
VDRFHETTGLRRMSRSTGFTATAVARLVLDGTFRQPGAHPPETLGAIPGLLDRVLADLRARGVRCRSSVSALRT